MADAMRAAEGIKVPLEECRAQLNRIIQSRDFEATARERKFLQYVVDEEIEGRGARIKAYSIAIEVFGREASFDSQNDPIVRIEAGHLRRSLERYYLTGGRSDSILIAIPKGAYVPTFTHRVPYAFDSLSVGEPRYLTTVLPQAVATIEPQLLPGPNWFKRYRVPALVGLLILAAVVAIVAKFMAGAIAPAMPGAPRLLVERFEDLGLSGSIPLASGLTQEVIGELSKFRDLTVFQSLDPGSPRMHPHYTLSGSVSSSGDSFRLRARLIDTSDGSVLWANNYDGDMSVEKVVAAQADIAENVATSLAQIYGVIFQADARLALSQPPDDWEAYTCTLSFYAYRTNLDLKALGPVRSCLEKAVKHFPNYATAWGLLAQTYIDEVRFRFPFDPVASRRDIELALATARHAVELDAFNVRGLQAEMFGLFFTREYAAARALGERALSINPNDTELMGEFGYRLALSGNWEDGCPWIAKARARNPGPLSYYESGLALCAYFSGDNASAVMWIRKTPASENALYHLIAAVVYAGADQISDVQTEWAWLQASAPALVDNVTEEVAQRLGRPEDVSKVLDSLRKAGLDLPR